MGVWVILMDVMNRRSYLIGLGVFSTVGAISSVAFTTAQASRDVEIDITSDDQAIIGLNAGDSDAAEINGGVLEIDASIGSDGLNIDGAFVFGDVTDPTNTYTFSITNNDVSTHTFTLSFDQTDASGTVQFRTYDDTGTDGDIVTAGSDGEVSLAGGETAYVILDVDTTGASEGNNIGGELTISVEN